MAEIARPGRRHRPLFLALLALVALGGCSTAPRKSAQIVEKKNRAAEYTTFGNRAFAEGDNHAAIVFFQQALAVNLSVDNQTGVVQSLSSLGKVHAAQGELDAAEEVYNRARRLADGLGDPALGAQCAVNLGELYLRRGKAAEARELLTKALEGADKLEGSRDLALLRHTLAVAEKWLGNLDESALQLQAALAINLKLGAVEEVASNYYLLASVASKRQDYATALDYARKALESDKSVENSLGIAQDLLALGIISTRLGALEDSFAYLERSYGIYDALDSSSGRLTVLPYLVESAERAGRSEEAAAYARILQTAQKK